MPRLFRYLDIGWKLQAVKMEASITAPFSLLNQQEDGQEWSFFPSKAQYYVLYFRREILIRCKYLCGSLLNEELS